MPNPTDGIPDYSSSNPKLKSHNALKRLAQSTQIRDRNPYVPIHTTKENPKNTVKVTPCKLPATYYSPASQDQRLDPIRVQR